MNAKQFFNLVAEMRAAQRYYFDTRYHCYLVKSKELEARVDTEIARVKEVLAEQEPAQMEIKFGTK